MIRKTDAILVLIVMTALCLPSLSQAQSPTPQETLKQYVAELQRNPNDMALREKIIKLAQEMEPAPAIPEEAERYMARGAAAVKGAKSAEDLRDAVAEFEKATLSAPWLADAYCNLGVAQDKAGQYAAAVRSLNFCLLAAPNAPDAKEVKTFKYEVEYRQEKAAKEASPEALAAKKKKSGEDFIRSLNGARYVRRTSDPSGWAFTFTIEIRDGQGIYTRHMDRAPSGMPLADDMIKRGAIQDRKFRFNSGASNHVCIINEDGSRVVDQSTGVTGGSTDETVFTRER